MDSIIESSFLFLLKIACTGKYNCNDNFCLSINECNKLIELAKRNYVSALIYYAIVCIEKERPLSETETFVQQSLYNDYIRDIAYDVQQQHYINHLKEVLTMTGIPFAFVKGAIIKNDYPETFLRFMSDIDICIYPEYRNRFHQVMQEIGAKESDIDGNDQNYTLNNRIRIETHGYTFFKRGDYGIQEYADSDFCPFSFGIISEEAYVLNLIGHMVKHFCKDGLQVRHVLDLWIYRHCHNPQPDWEIVMSYLKKDGLNIIAENLIKLGELWLGNDSNLSFDRAILRELTDISLNGVGVSSSEYRVLNDMALAGSKLKAIRSVLFLTKDEYIKRYPWLKKCIMLLPLAFLIRICSSVRSHSTMIRKWIKGMKNVDIDRIVKRQEQLKRYGL